MGVEGRKGRKFGITFYMLLSKLMKFYFLLTVELGIRGMEKNKDEKIPNSEAIKTNLFHEMTFEPIII